MRGIIRDAVYSLRLLRINPAFTVVAVLTIAVGVGANVAIYSVIDAVLIHPLPFEDAGRLVFVWGVEGGLKSGSSWNSYPDVQDFEAQNEVFVEMASFSMPRLTLTGGDREPGRVAAARISHDLFSVLGVQPAEGRGILPEEDRAGGEPVVVISDGLRNDLLGEAVDVLGSTLTVDGIERTIVGVMPPGFQFPNQARLWIPLGPEHAGDGRGAHRLLTVARLRPAVSQAQANANMATIAATLEAEYPKTNTNRGARIEPMSEALLGEVRPPLLLLFGAVGLVLLIACTNVASLLLARVTVRRRELAVRAALGAGPWRLLRQLLTESLLLALIGGLCGMVVAVWSLELLVSMAPSGIPRIDSVGINPRVLMFSLAVTLAAGVLFGLAPALHARTRDMADNLKEGARGFFGGGRNRLRSGLVIAEIALAFVVCVAAGLLTTSFLRLTNVDPGFRGEDVLTARVALPRGSYPEWRQATALFDRLIQRLEELPGVESAAAGYEHPLSGGWETSFVLPGVLEAPEGERPEARVLPVTPGYFRTVGMKLLHGRDFLPGDDENAPGVVIVNESFARRFFPGDDAVGHRLVRDRWWDELPGDWEIIGVAADVKMDGLASGTPWAMYYPQKQVPFQQMYVFVRSSIEPTALANSVRNIVWEMDSDLPVEDVRVLGDRRHAALAKERFQVTLLNLFGVIALVLAVVGIYGVLSSVVAERRAEIGVRMALGASRQDVLRAVVGQGMRLTLVGLVLGLGGALATTRLLAGLLFQVSPTHLPTLGGVMVFFSLVAVLACVIPAVRAARVDPMVALRAE